MVDAECVLSAQAVRQGWAGLGGMESSGCAGYMLKSRKENKEHPEGPDQGKRRGVSASWAATATATASPH